MDVKVDGLTPELMNKLIISRIPAGRLSDLNLKTGSEDISRMTRQLVYHCFTLIAESATGTNDLPIRLQIDGSDDKIAAAFAAFDCDRFSHNVPTDLLIRALY
jgi:hypothetical protein